MTAMTVSVVMPARNEEAHIESAIARTLQAFDTTGLSGELIVVDDGSGDATGKKTDECIGRDGRVRKLVHGQSLGMGASFWDGARAASGELVTMIPGVDENDALEILRYAPLMEQVDIVNPYVVNRDVRAWSRRALSWVFLTIVNAAFGLRLHYTNGTVLYRRCILEGVQPVASGFFFQAEALAMLIGAGYLYAEVPCLLSRREVGRSHAISWRAARAVVRDFLRVFWLARMEGRRACKPGEWAEGSATRRRLVEQGGAL